MHVLETERLLVRPFAMDGLSVNVMERVGMRVGTNPDPDVVYPWAVGTIENKLEDCDANLPFLPS